MSAKAELTEKVLVDVKQVARDSKQLLQDCAGTVAEKAHEMSGHLTHAVELGKAACRRLQEKSKETARTADKAIRHHPYQSMGIAFGIGLVVGLVVTRKQ